MAFRLDFRDICLALREVEVKVAGGARDTYLTTPLRSSAIFGPSAALGGVRARSISYYSTTPLSKNKVDLSAALPATFDWG